MKKLGDYYYEWCRFLEEDARAYMTYRDICRMLKVPPADLNEAIMEATGMSGEEVLRLYLW